MELLVYGGKVIFCATYKELHIMNIRRRSKFYDYHTEMKTKIVKTEARNSFNFVCSKRIEEFSELCLDSF